MALITQNALDANISTDGTTITTASVSPGSNRLILAGFVFSFLSVVASAPACSVAGNGLTWVQIANRVFRQSGANYWQCLYLYRALGASPSSGTITATSDGFYHAAYAVSEFIGIDTSGTNGSGAIVQSATNWGDGVGSLTVTLSSFSNANNATYGLFTASAGTQLTFTPGTGFTEIHDTGQDYASIGTQWRNDNDTSVDSTFSGTASGSAGIAVEIKAALPVGGIMLLTDHFRGGFL